MLWRLLTFDAMYFTVKNENAMTFNRRNLGGIGNIVFAILTMTDRIIEKKTITPLFAILCSGMLLTGIYVMYEDAKKNEV